MFRPRDSKLCQAFRVRFCGRNRIPSFPHPYRIRNCKSTQRSVGTFIRRSVVSRQRVIFVSPSSTKNIPDFDREFVVHVVDAAIEEGVGAFFGSAVLFSYL